MSYLNVPCFLPGHLANASYRLDMGMDLCCIARLSHVMLCYRYERHYVIFRFIRLEYRIRILLLMALRGVDKPCECTFQHLLGRGLYCHLRLCVYVNTQGIRASSSNVGFFYG